MIRVYIAKDPPDAQIVCDLLNDNGLKAVVQGELLWGAQGEIPVGPATAPTVWVNEPDVERARGLIEQYESRPGPRPPPWTCPKCHQKVGGQFTACWRCGAAREEG